VLGRTRDLEATTCELREEIDRRQRVEKALRESEQKYRILVENANEAIFIAQEGKIKFVNQKTEELSGRNRQELLSTGFETFIHPNDRSLVRERHMKRQQGVKLPSNYSFRIIHKSGEEKWVELNVVAVQWEGKTATLNFLRDITERKRGEKEREALQAQLLQAQKLEAVGRLAGGVAHDFNNLLTVILGYAEMVLQDLHPGHPHHAFVKNICQAGNGARNLTRQLLAFSRKQVLDVQVVDVNDLIQGFEKLIRRLIGEDVSLKLTLHENPVPVKADISQMEQVLMNLAVNARDAMPEGGVLAIETGIVGLEEMDTSPKTEIAPGRHAMLTVTDTGVGMDAETLGRIFEPFFTTKERDRGTGLGLATSYGIVKQHGGNIYAFSEPGQGTTFKIDLPLCSEEEETAPRIVEELRPVTGTGTVLVVEDDASVLGLACDILRASGYTVIQAATPEEALDLALTCQASIDLILADVILPGMKGPDMVQQILEIHPRSRILYMSGYTEDRIAHDGILKKGILFIPKPFTAKALCEKAAEAMGRGKEE